MAGAASLYNLTGSEHGFGDVVGPYLLAQSAAAEEKTYLLLDDRAEQVLKTFLEKPAGLVSTERLIYVRPAAVNKLADVDRIFEAFAGARGGAKADPASLLPKAERTVVIAQDLHSPYGRAYFPAEFRASGLSEIKARGTQLYFSAAGLGTERLGILADPSVDPYVGKTSAEARALAARRFDGAPLGALLKKERHPEAMLSFAYGVHNEIFSSPRWKPYPGQFRSYLKGLARIARREGRPVVLLTPNKEEILREAMGKRPAATLESSEAFFSRKALRPGRVHVVSTGALSNSQFVALTAAADLPYLIEGDSALSAAVRLGKPFVMMKGPWGLFGIDGLSMALSEAGAPWAKGMYPILAEPGSDTPNFARLDLVHDDPASFARLKKNARDWSHSMARIAALAEGGAPAEAVLAEIKDPLLRYSWLRSQDAKGALSAAEFRAATAALPGAADFENLIRAREVLARPVNCGASYGTLAR